MAKGRSVADEVDRGLGVMADFFHVNIEHGSVDEALRLAGDKLHTFTWQTVIFKCLARGTSISWTSCARSIL